MFTKIKIEGNKVTPQEVEDAILGVTYTKIGEKITVAHVTLVDGFEVIGKSGVVDPKNYDSEIGNKIALDNAKNEIWKHMGSILQDRIVLEKGSYHVRLVNERDELKIKADKLKDAILNKRVPENAVEILNKQWNIMSEYLFILNKRLE